LVIFSGFDFNLFADIFWDFINGNKFIPFLKSHATVSVFVGWVRHQRNPTKKKEERREKRGEVKS